MRFDHSRPYHPQTCGKVEGFHQTQKKWLASRLPAARIGQLQRQLDAFRRYYNRVPLDPGLWRSLSAQPPAG